MRFVFISERTFEPWTWENCDNPGIGGSETSHIEMSRRLSERGHDVISYAPVPLPESYYSKALAPPTVSLSDYAPRRGPGNIWWYPVEALPEFEWDSGDVAVVYRAPRIIDQLPTAVISWLICQDVDYQFPGNELNSERAGKFTRIVALCKAHTDYLHAKFPTANVVQSSNGIRSAQIENFDPPARDPFKLIYASSPDRGLQNLLKIFKRAHEAMPELTLDLYYGFDNMDKVIERRGPKHQAALIKNQLLKMMDQPGITWYGRTGQYDLMSAWFKASIWCHPSNSTETSCITCMDAQACGAIPITQPVWAVAENVRYGTFIDGNADTPIIQARYVREILQLASESTTQGEIRLGMMRWAREQFDWENFVTQWEQWAEKDESYAEERSIYKTFGPGEVPEPIEVAG